MSLSKEVGRVSWGVKTLGGLQDPLLPSPDPSPRVHIAGSWGGAEAGKLLEMQKAAGMGQVGLSTEPRRGAGVRLLLLNSLDFTATPRPIHHRIPVASRANRSEESVQRKQGKSGVPPPQSAGEKQRAGSCVPPLLTAWSVSRGKELGGAPE